MSALRKQFFICIGVMLLFVVQPGVGDDEEPSYITIAPFAVELLEVEQGSEVTIYAPDLGDTYESAQEKANYYGNVLTGEPAIVLPIREQKSYVIEISDPTAPWDRIQMHGAEGTSILATLESVLQVVTVVGPGGTVNKMSEGVEAWSELTAFAGLGSQNYEYLPQRFSERHGVLGAYIKPEKIETKVGEIMKRLREDGSTLNLGLYRPECPLPGTDWAFDWAKQFLGNLSRPIDALIDALPSQGGFVAGRPPYGVGPEEAAQACSAIQQRLDNGALGRIVVDPWTSNVGIMPMPEVNNPMVEAACWGVSEVLGPIEEEEYYSVRNPADEQVLLLDYEKKCIWADRAGGSDMASISNYFFHQERRPLPPTNRTPAFDSTEKSERREIHASRGGGGGGKYGDLLLMDPSWAHRGCFTVTDPDGDELDIYLGSAPMYGEAGVVYSGAEGEYTATVTYQLPLEEILATHYGEGVIEDFFTIVAQDPEGEADEATINLVIEVMNRGVSAGADAAVTEAGVPVLIDVLANDSDQDGDPLFIESVGETVSGTVAILGDEVEYTPNADFCCGIDGFAYVVTDQCGSEATGVVAVLVVDSVSPTFDQWPGDIEVEASSDAGKVVTFTVTAVDNCDPAPIAACYPPSGTTFPIGTSGVLCEALDHCGNSLLDAFTVTVVRANRPPVAVNDIAHTGVEIPVLIPVLENDYDPDGDAFWIVSVSYSVHGVKPEIVGDQILYGGGPPQWNADNFTYTIEDEHGAQASADVKVNIGHLKSSLPGEEDAGGS